MALFHPVSYTHLSLSLADMPAEGYDIGQVLDVEIGVKPAE